MGIALGFGSAIFGGIVGAIKKPGLGAETELEQQGRAATQENFKSLRDILGAGPGKEEFLTGIQAQKDLAVRLQGLTESGGLPSRADIRQTRDLAGGLFAGQREQLNQDFEQQRIQASRQAALSGRAAFDPILANKLAQSQTRQSRLLSSQEGAFGIGLALQQPERQLGFARERTGILTGLGQQGISNRNFLLGLGRNLQQSERSNRFQSAKFEGSRGGGFGGAFSGAIAGAGAGLSIGSFAQRAFGGGSGGSGLGGFTGSNRVDFGTPELSFVNESRPRQTAARTSSLGGGGNRPSTMLPF